MILIIGGAGNTQSYFSMFMRLIQIELLQQVRFLPLEESNADSIEKLFKEAYDSKRVLIGFSLGANAALAFSNIYTIDKLILVSPISIFDMVFNHNGVLHTAKSYQPLKSCWWNDMRIAKRLICFVDSFIVGREILSRLYKTMNPKSPKMVLDEIHRQGYTNLLDNIETYVTKINMGESLSNTRAKRILIICGKQDEFLHVSKTIECTSNDSRIQVRICEGDHHILLINPEDVLLRMGVV